MGPNDPFAVTGASPQRGHAAAPEPNLADPPSGGSASERSQGRGADPARLAWLGFGIGTGLGLLGLLTSPLAAVGVAVAGLVGALVGLLLATLSRELPRLRRLGVRLLTDAPD